MNPIGRPLIRLDSVTSTMDVTRCLLAEGATAGTAVLAGYQSAGRGRSNRTWVAPPGEAILLSFLTSSSTPIGQLGLLSLCWGVAVAETVEALTDHSARIKWPNDVLVNGRKISGILVQNTPRHGRQWQVTGVGLNVGGGQDTLPETATSLALLRHDSPTIDDVLPVLLARLDVAFAMFERGESGEVSRLVTSRLAMLGDEVTIVDGGSTVSGTLHGLAGDGALLLADAAGEVRRIVVGELTRGPRSADDHPVYLPG